MLEIEKPRIEVEEYIKDEFYGKFVIEPLKRGYGTTLGEFLTSSITIITSWSCSNIYLYRGSSTRIHFYRWCS